MSTLSKLFTGLADSARRGDHRAVEGACQAALLLLHQEGSGEDVSAPDQVLGALQPILSDLAPEALGPVALLIDGLAVRGAASGLCSRATSSLWSRQDEVTEGVPAERYWRGLGNLLARQDGLRRSLGADAPQEPFSGEAQRLVAALLRAPDVLEVRVLHPGLERGYQVSVRGALDVAQLQVLLAGALLGSEEEGLLPGIRPSEAALRACAGGVVPLQAPVTEACWNLLHPSAMGSGGLSDDVEHWIWGETSTADLPRWSGTPTVLLGPLPYARSWPAMRAFEAHPAELSLDRILPAAEVRSELQALAHPSP